MRKLALCLLLTSVLGCSGEPPGDETEAPGESVFDDQVQTLDRARDTEQELKDAADARRRALEDQGG